MSSGKRWALYATNLRAGTWREHRLAGARLGPFGTNLEYHLPNGWEASVYWFRLSLHFKVAIRQGDPRFRDWLDFVMPPSSRAELTQAKADIDSGRGYRWDSHAPEKPSVPLATWRPDDPIQPDGWHHDGKRWVLNDTGWFEDRAGFWRYNKPGDAGWTELDDGSWHYTVGMAR